ncbi:MAG: hypothetical protein IIW51_06170, partial [Peptococcaceae bacterium]|nr:hypothetical protein [Peptococcaceae bacterium]
RNSGRNTGKRKGSFLIEYFSIDSFSGCFAQKILFVNSRMWTENAYIERLARSYPHYPQMGQLVLWITERKSVNKIQKKEQKAIAK